MKKLRGKGVCQGIAIGKVYYFRHEDAAVEKHEVKDVESELLRFHQAQKKEIDELDALYQKALKEVGEKNAGIFQIHRMMIEDEEFVGSVEKSIRDERVNAEYAVSRAASAAAETLGGMPDDYLKARTADIKEVFDNLVRYMTGKRVAGLRLDEPVILASDDLSPSETMKLDRSNILAFLTARGSCNSHTAILARSMNLPAVVAVGDELGPGDNGKTAVVDGERGELYLDPDPSTLRDYEQWKKRREKEARLLDGLRGLENVTRDGRKIRIYANVGNLDDIATALHYDAGGIGLFRSEFIFLGRDRLPTEEEQFEIYRTALEKMQGKEVVIRTLDIGADKKADYLGMPEEQNPALGCRAIRFCLTRPEIFKTQLRALYRASAYGRLLIMLPMITSVREIVDCRRLAKEAQSELTRQGIPFGSNVPFGIMVETPAAAMVSGDLAEAADFFSIGTNDLTQYTLAIDRQNSALERFCDPHHPAVLKLIRITVENAHRHGIWVGICGELGADETLTRLFLDMGIDELSVSSPRILALRKTVREI